jgi:hypothetical protein
MSWRPFEYGLMGDRDCPFCAAEGHPDPAVAATASFLAVVAAALAYLMPAAGGPDPVFLGFAALLTVLLAWFILASRAHHRRLRVLLRR